MKEKGSASQQFFIGIIANGQFKDLALAVLPKLPSVSVERVLAIVIS